MDVAETPRAINDSALRSERRPLLSDPRKEHPHNVSGAAKRIVVYHPGTQHSLILARTLAKKGYNASLVTRFETASAMRQSAVTRSAYKVLGRSHTMQRAIENRSVGAVQSFSTDAAGVLLDRLIGETLGRSAMQHFARFRNRHSAKAAAKLIRRQIHPQLVIAHEDGAFELLDELGTAVSVVIDVAHPHPMEVDRCRRLASARYPGFQTSWDDPPFNASACEQLNQVFTRATGVWTASQYTADSIRTFVDPAIPLDIVGYGAVGISRPSQRLTYEGRYLFVGAVGLRKGIPLLLEAWDKSGLASEGCVLDVVGRKLDPHVEAVLEHSTGVRRHVDISDEALSKLFQRADALVSPSYCEGFGRVLIEAVNAGLPFLATRTGGVDDILGSDLSEWCVEVNDLEGFTELLRRFHDEGSSRADYFDAVLSMQRHWTEEAYGSRLQRAVEQQLNSK
jgi:glycosyltransferase involved in cell wall biosynthesis